MKKASLFSLALIAVGVFVLVAAGQANADVAGSKHDLTTATGAAVTTTGATDRVCVFCHTPHGAAPGDAPLWNRALPAGPFDMYDSATIDMTIAGAPQGVSLACLSCHDGSIAFDQLYNGPGSGDYQDPPTSRGWAFTGGTVMPAGVTNIGQDLRNDHPVSITYDPSLDANNFHPATDVDTAGLPLYGASGDQVECGTCHNPHDTSNGTFLRMDNAASALCTTCHIK